MKQAEYQVVLNGRLVDRDYALIVRAHTAKITRPVSEQTENLLARFAAKSRCWDHR